MENTKLMYVSRDVAFVRELDKRIEQLLVAHIPTVKALMDAKKTHVVGDVIWTDVSRMSFYVRPSLAFSYEPKYVDNVQKMTQEDFDALPDNIKFKPTNPRLYLHIEGLSGGPIIANAEVNLASNSVKIIGEITRTQNLGVTNFHDALTVFDRLKSIDLLKDNSFFSV